MISLVDQELSDAVARFQARMLRPAPLRYYRGFNSHIADRMRERADRRGVHPRARELAVSEAWKQEKERKRIERSE